MKILSATIFRRSLVLAVVFSIGARANGLVLEETIVTAQKRSERVQDIPSTINALTRDSLERFTVLQFDEISGMTPGVDLQRVDARRQTITIRGVTADPDNVAAQPISSYWNGVAVAQPVAFNALYDIERIEILRGAQGTLQGRTDPSGAILINTRKPNVNSMDGYIQQSFADNEGSNTQFGVSIPLIEDTLGLRIAGLYDENNGQEYQNLSTGQEDRQVSRSGRLTLSWMPSEELEATLFYNRMDNDARILASIEGDPGGYPIDLAGTTSPVVTNPDYPTYLKAGDRKAIHKARVGYQLKDDQVVVQLNWDIAQGSLSYVGGYSETDTENLRDLDISNALPVASPMITITESSSESHELRFASNEGAFGGFWDYQVGLYYEDVDSQTDNVVDAAGNFMLFGLPQEVFLTVLDIPIKRTNKAIFTHNTFNFGEQLQMVLGLRYQDISTFARADATTVNDYPFGPENGTQCLIPDGSDCSHSGADLTTVDENAVTGSLKFSWFMLPETMLYGGYDRSYRPPGATITPTLVSAENLLFDSETSDSLELGFKSTFAGGRARVNGALFWQRFDGYLARATDVNATFYDSDGAVTSSTRVQGGITYNADATITGAEFEFQSLLTETWYLNGGVSYADATFDNGEQGPCNRALTPEEGMAQVEIASCDIGGNRLSTQPLWSVNLSTEYRLPVDANEWYVRALYNFSSERVDELVEGDDISSYGVASAWAGLRGNDGRWDVNIWVKNLFDTQHKAVPANREFVSVGPISATSNWRRATMIQPRLVGVSLRYNFSAQ